MAIRQVPSGPSVWSIALALIIIGALVAAIHPLPHLLASRDTEAYAALTSQQRVQFEASLRASMIQALAGVLLVLGAVTGLRQLRLAREQATSDSSAKFVEAFTRAVEQLQSGLAVSGVYALDRLAEAHPKEAARIVDVLCAFVRRTKHVVENRDGAEAAIRVTATRADDDAALNFAGAYLAGAQLEGLKLKNASFRGADLREANLSRTILTNSDFRDADLSRANLEGADLSKADLEGATKSAIRVNGQTKLPG